MTLTLRKKPLSKKHAKPRPVPAVIPGDPEPADSQPAKSTRLSSYTAQSAQVTRTAELQVPAASTSVVTPNIEVVPSTFAELRQSNPALGRRTDHDNSRIAAVALFCLAHRAGDPGAVEGCEVLDCPLWRYRMGKSPAATPDGMPTTSDYVRWVQESKGQITTQDVDVQVEEPTVDILGVIESVKQAEVEKQADQPDTRGKGGIPAWLSEHPGWHSRSVICTRLGLTTGQWNVTIKELVNSGTVERTGERRSTKYRLPGVGVAAVTLNGDGLGIDEPTGDAKGNDDPKELCDDVLTWLDANRFDDSDGWHSRKEIIDAIGLTVGEWNETIKSLFASAEVERQGVKRATKYRVAGAEE